MNLLHQNIQTPVLVYINVSHFTKCVKMELNVNDCLQLSPEWV